MVVNRGVQRHAGGSDVARSPTLPAAQSSVEEVGYSPAATHDFEHDHERCQMDSALRPRDIQARIRAGESVDDVAQAAGVSVERIEPFAGPVLAERSHVAGLALTSPVRRRGESTSHRSLRNAAIEALVARGIDPDTVEWDAALLGARRWQITAAFEKSGRQHRATFVFDLAGRFSVAGDDDARWMIGEASAVASGQPARPDAEDDELAIVRALQSPAPEDAETDDAYSDGDLAEVDGVYELVGRSDPQMDALYDLLASFDEDSVKIYTGLVNPVTDPVVAEPDPEPAPLDDAAQTRWRPRPSRIEAPANDGPFDLDAAPAAVADEAEQPALIEQAAPPAPKQPKRSRRASVPSWDEIMFGAPRQGKDPR